jgi:hypothetical protein
MTCRAPWQVFISGGQRISGERWGVCAEPTESHAWARLELALSQLDQAFVRKQEISPGLDAFGLGTAHIVLGIVAVDHLVEDERGLAEAALEPSVGGYDSLGDLLRLGQESAPKLEVGVGVGHRKTDPFLKVRLP